MGGEKHRRGQIEKFLKDKTFATNDLMMSKG
jgi:hypothetical protein